MSELVRYVDSAMYRAEPAGKMAVTVLNATPDPLGSVAALCNAYKGIVVRELVQVTHEDRRRAFADMQKTVLNGPLESVKLHLLVEGCSRALVDQMTRGRAAFYAVESLRFAVKEDWATDFPLPPSLAGLPEDDPRLVVFRGALNRTEDAYAALVSAGVPAEDARRLLPIGIQTRAHWVLDLRELLAVAGKRLCTQAEFEWRVLFSLLAEALRGWGGRGVDGWQWDLIADTLRPVCYQQGHCGFMAQFDRGCTIRERVEANAARGRPSSEWHAPTFTKANAGHVFDAKGMRWIGGINSNEWLLDPTAARGTETGTGDAA
jgi:flavin-dependent thymidylate synthase